MIASAAKIAPVLERHGESTRKRHGRLEIEFLTCRISYNMCDTQNSEKRVLIISDLAGHFKRDICDTAIRHDRAALVQGVISARHGMCDKKAFTWLNRRKLFFRSFLVSTSNHRSVTE